MSYADNTIAEVLNFADKIGIAKASRVFNVCRSTIYGWIKEKNAVKKESGANPVDPNLPNHKNLLLRRVFIKNNHTNYYLYNLKDLESGFEFNSIAFNNNYQTPLIFLKYVLKAYLKQSQAESLVIHLKGFTRVSTLAKFKNLFDNCKIEVLRTAGHFDLVSFDKKKISTISDEVLLMEFLTDEQLCYNISKSTNEQDVLQFFPPVIVDKSGTDANNSNFLLSVCKRLTIKINNMIRSAAYDLAWKYLEIIRVILHYAQDPKSTIKYYEQIFEFYTVQSKFSEALLFLEEINKGNVTHPEAVFFIHLKICDIHIRNYNTKKFDEYYDKLKLLYNHEFKRDLLLEYDLLVKKRKSLYLPVEESIDSYEKILVKYKNHISLNKLFNIYIQLVSLYQSVSRHKETDRILGKIKILEIVNSDSYLMCRYYETAGKCLYLQGLFDEAFNFYNLLESVSRLHGYKDFYYESKGLISLILMNQGKFELAKIEADKFLHYGEMTSNYYTIFKASIILQRYYERTGNLNKALKYNQRELDLCGHFLNIKYEASAVNNRCYLLSRLNNSYKMTIFINRFEKLNKILKDPRKKIQILMYKAYYYHSKNKLEDSLACYQQALNCSKKYKMPNFSYMIYSHIAELKSLINEFKSAIININHSIYIYLQNDNNSDLPRLIFIKAQTYFAANKYDKAITNLHEAKKLCLEYKNSYVLDLCNKLEIALANKMSEIQL